MKIRSTILALGIAATLTGCQNMDSNGLLSSGAEAFQAYSLSDEQKRLLPKPAQVFAQAFADDLKGTLSEKSLQKLPEDGADLFDDAIYRIAYKDVVKHLPK